MKFPFSSFWQSAWFVFSPSLAAAPGSTKNQLAHTVRGFVSNPRPHFVAAIKKTSPPIPPVSSRQ